VIPTRSDATVKFAQLNSRDGNRVSSTLQAVSSRFVLFMPGSPLKTPLRPSTRSLFL
jgi:hypothetical protein